MTPDDQSIITVDNELFLGRVEEQKQFRAALMDLLNLPPGEELPYVILLYGDGGMGKTTLAKRFRDIAQIEQPFEGEFQMLWVDWEDEQKRYASLQVGREHISPETVFDVLHAVAIRQKWGGQFGAYQEAVKKRGEAEKKAAEALVASGEQDELAVVRGVGAGALAMIVRSGLPMIGQTGEKLAQVFLDAGIKASAEQAARWRAALETRLQARLKPELYNFFLNPHEQLAHALADGLKRAAAGKTLLVFLDTYEIVDRADIWLRMAIKAAGPHILWVIGGRDDLMKSRQFGVEYFKGYAEDFPRRLVAYDMRQLALEDIRKYFSAHAADRPLTDSDAEAISRATRGIPLAIRETAEIWKKGTPLVEIVGDTTDATPRKEIVGKMTARYLLHVVAEADKYALYALTLARGAVEILRAMLRPVDGSAFDLDARLNQLERDYASVHAESARLHDEPALFFSEYLKDEKRRTDDRVKALNQRAVDALHEQLKKLEADLPLMEERCADDDWAKAALDLTYHMFWLDESEAWHWFIPRFVEGLTYSHDLQRSLLTIANKWEDHLSKSGKKRLKVLRPEASRSVEEDDKAMVDELTRLESLGWLKDDGETERHAILDLRRGQLLYQREKYNEALAMYERTERGLPEKGEALKKQLGEAYEEVGWKLGYREGSTGYDALPVEIAERAYARAIALERKTGECYRRRGRIQLALGRKEEALQSHLKAIEIEPNEPQNYAAMSIVCFNLGRYDEAMAAYQRVVDLDPKNANAHNGLGNVYRDLGRHEDAIAAYQRAVDLDPKNANAHNGLGNVYLDLERYDEAMAAYQRAVDLDPKEVWPYIELGLVYELQKKYGQALELYQKAVELHTSDEVRAVSYSNLGNVYGALERYDEAMAAYQRAVDLDPKNANAHDGLGDVYRALGRHSAAKAAFQQAIELEPEDSNAHNKLGMIYEMLGQPEYALSEYQRAVELEPQNGSWHSSLVSILGKLGRELERNEEIKITRALILERDEYSRACFESICGNVDEALALLRTALEKKQISLEWARRDPDFDFIRDDPRFKALVGE